MSGDFEKAFEIAVVLLREFDFPTVEDIRAKVQEALRLFPGVASRDEDLVRLLESMFNVRVGVGTQLFDNSNHEAWLPHRRSEIEWRYWDRYAKFLSGEKSWPSAVVERLEERVDTVLGMLEDPRREGNWDRRGLVVGNVQSGKTSNYTGLICKAVDAGYQLIIVLAGVHNSLRSQTQMRLDEGFLGYDSVQLQLGAGGPQTPIGVARFDRSCPTPNSITNRADKGDFKKVVAQQFNITPGGKPLLFVVKKHVSVLRNLVDWVRWSAPLVDDATGRGIVPDIPLLVIDDEADYASIDTTRLPTDENGQPLADHDPTRTNGRIRELLSSFAKSAYVGYTATPFANVYIHEGAVADNYGPDLFPRAFIMNLPAPSNYVGPARVFGISSGQDADSDEGKGLPIIRKVKDEQDWIPARHDKSLVPSGMPDSLRRAIKSFLLTCACRTARGQQTAHNSMLVHVTRFTAVQEHVGRQIEDELKAIKRRIKRGDGQSESQLMEELRQLWEKDFVPTTEAIGLDDCPAVSWSEIEAVLFPAVERIEVRLINGSAGDILDYADHSKVGLNVIAVGGDKLSRGLTLEGLSVSYYLRASRMYDTLMQMGRWFGYRPGYLDLCRLFTTDDLVDWYRHISVADEELRELFEAMAAVRATPEDFGIRVRSHPDLLVTGPVKMRNGFSLNLSFRGDISETIFFDRNEEVVKRNFSTVEELVRSLGEPHKTIREKTLVWRDVPADSILEGFLRKIKVNSRAQKVVPELLSSYIRNCNAEGELTNWTVALIGTGDGGIHEIAGREVQLVRRKVYPEDSLPEEVGYYRIRRLVNPTDEYIDLNDEQKDAALGKTRQAWEEGKVRGEKPPTRPSGLMIRSIRPKTNGLLLLYPLDPKHVEGSTPVIGFALSFPDSKALHAVNYVVNNVYYKQEYGEE